MKTRNMTRTSHGDWVLAVCLTAGRYIMVTGLVVLCAAAAHADPVILTNTLVRFQFDTGTTGIDFTDLTDLSTGVVIHNASASLWRVYVKNAGGTEVAVVPNIAGFGYTVETLPDGAKQLSAHWPQVPVDGSNTLAVDVQISLPQDSDTAQWRIDTDWAAGADYSVYQVDFPFLSIVPIGTAQDSRLAMSFLGGSLLEDPIATFAANNNVFVNDALGGKTGYPGVMTMQFHAFYDVPSRQILYLAADDNNLNLRRYVFSAESGRLVYFIRNVPQGNRIPGNSFSMPYNALVGAFKGKSAECWYDAAERYREWAVEQPWCARGRWEDSTEVSALVRDQDFWLLMSGGATNAFSSYVNVADQWKQALGTDSAVSLWYRWENGGFNYYTPENFPALSTFGPSIGSAHESNQFIFAYTNAWSYSTAAPNYAANQVEQTMAMILENGSVVQVGESPVKSLMCMASDAWRDASDAEIQQLITDYDVDGAYLDYWGGDFPCYSTNHNHVPGGGNEMSQGKIALGQYIRDRARALKPDFFMTTESLQESTIGVLDMMFQTSYAKTLKISLPASLNVYHVPLFNTVYHEYVNASSFGAMEAGFSATDNISLFNLGLASCAHYGEMLSVTNWFGNSPNLVDQGNAKEVQFVAFLRERVDLSKAAAPYIKFGRRMRPLNVTAVATSNASTRFPGADFNGDQWQFPQSNTLPHVLASVWQAKDGSMAIILGNWTGNAESITYQFDPTLYGLPHNAAITITDLMGAKIGPEQRIGAFSDTRVVPAWSFAAIQLQIEILDADLDGLLDEWETADLDPETPGIQNPFDPDTADSTGDDFAEGPDGIPDGQNDWDGDGVSNADEFVWGTNAADPGSFPSLPAVKTLGLSLILLVLLGTSLACLRDGCKFRRENGNFLRRVHLLGSWRKP